MSIFKKKTSQPKPTKTLTRTLKLHSIQIQLYFGASDGTDRFQADIRYKENPRGSYDQQGLEQSEGIEADSWPEMVSKINEILEVE